MRSRSLFVLMMSLGIALSMASVSTYAKENENQTVVENGIPEIPKELIVDREVWENVDTMKYSIYTYPIEIGTSPQEQIGFIQLNDNGYTKGLVVLTGDMLEDFDSSTIGEKSYILRNKGGWARSVQVKVVENVDKNLRGKPASIQASIIGVDGNKMDIGTSIKGGTIDVLDNLGNIIYSVELKEENISAYDNTQIGTKSFLISYNALTTTLEIEFHRYTYYEIYKPWGINAGSEFIVPIGTDLKKVGVSAKTYAVDEHGSIVPTGMGGGTGLAPELIAQIDTAKAGVYDVEVKSTSEVDDNEYIVKAKVIVGLPNQSTIEELLPIEAQNTLPNHNIVGIWDVPSGEAGAGTWCFQTGIEKGSMVDVWSYHKNAWLPIGTYAVAANGEISVAFTADQLSPILVTKAEKGSTASSSNTEAVIKDTSTKANDYRSILFLLSISCVLISVVVIKKKEEKRTEMNR